MIQNRFACTAIVLALAIPVPSPASVQSLAIRADFRTVENRGDRVTVEVVTRAAPEDRGLLGADPWLSLELRQAGETIVRWAGQSAMGDDGAVRLEMTVRPGTYELEVSLTALEHRHRGVWTGTVTIGDSPPIPAVTATPRPSRTSTPRPSSPPPTNNSAQAPSTPPDTGQATITAAISTTAATPPDDVAPSPPRSVPDAEALASAAAPIPTAVQTPDATATPTPRPTATPTPEPAPPAAPTWSELPPSTRDVTLQLVIPQRQLSGRTDLIALSVGGRAAPLMAIGASDAPLFMAVVVQAPPERRADLAEMLAPRIMELLRAGGGGAAVVDGPTAAWNDTAAAIADSLRTSTSSEPLVERMTTALDLLAEQPGRRVLLLHTEGGPAADRSAWKPLTERTEASGAQLLVSALWTDDLVERDRRQLRKIANATGGRMELVEASSLLEKVFDTIVRRLAATAVVRIQAGPAGRVQVESIPPATVEAFPERLR